MGKSRLCSERKILQRLQLIKSLKIAAAAAIAIGLAGELGLKYSATAGIITVLSIQNTKRETLKSAGNRWLAFLCALALSKLSFTLLGYGLWAFGTYLFLFALLCICAGWTEAIAMDSVLVTHFLAERDMGLSLVAGEVLLLLIGTGMGILVNLHLRRRQGEFERLAEAVDRQMKGILHRMSLWLPEEDKAAYGPDCFPELKEALHAAKACAVSDYGNTLLAESAYELDYIAMREQQSMVLREIYDNIMRIRYLPVQAEQVAKLLEEIGEDFHRDNTVEGLLEKLEALLTEMKSQPLPDSREEFEARAILFYILMQVRQFLEIKREFVLSHGQDQD